jgi:uncharacterized protein (TIGR00299 family) protein
MKTLYFDCSSGISGDMTLGALVDAGADLNEIQSGIDSLGLPECRLRAESVKRRGFRGLKIHVEAAEEKAHRHLHHITRMIDGSRLNGRQKDMARRVFERLAAAEAHVHGTTMEKVHFHEVGAVDSIADIVGSAIGLDLLGIDEIVCSPIPTGSGYITIEHGRVAVPAPATAELLRGVPLAASSVTAELTTPTGAAIAATLASRFGNLPSLAIEAIGYGAGSRDFAEHANLLRVIVGRSAEPVPSDRICVLETNLDDVSAEIVGHCTQQLLDAGALDVYTTAIQMKKNRPGVKLSVLCRPQDVEQLESMVFAETSSIGIRRWHADRHVLPRQTCEVVTRWGSVQGKMVTLRDETVRFTPEYESCRSVASAQGVPLQQVYQEALAAFSRLPNDEHKTTR